ncbi:MAG: HEPN domain-containing protein [Nitrosarchaeum sp.]|nr:HEPN domain-containing protein [Nitrosarchaeum sp.]
MKPSKNKLKWCAKQKYGIKIIKESLNLQKAYLKKSEDAIKSMDANAKEGINEWVVSTSYYAKYFVVYSLLSRIGIKCEIHDCTISLFEYLFTGKIPPKLIQDFQQSKDDRIDVQYYTQSIPINLNAIVADTKTFVLEIQKIIDNLTQSEIIILQSKLKVALQ